MINQPSGHTVRCGRINYHGYPNLWTELMVWEDTMFWLTNPLDRLGGVRMHSHDPPTLWTDLVVWEDALPPLTSNSPFHHSHNVFLPILEHISLTIWTHSRLSDGRARQVGRHTAGCETVETSMSFACNSSFLSVEGMTCLIPFESWRNILSNGV